jgi:hypothetical protein
MTLQRWVNAGPDEGAPAALLARVPQKLPVRSIDEVWVFPLRKVTDGESIVIVVSTFEPEPERRSVCTFRFTIVRNARGVAKVTERAGEHGSAPATALPRLIEGVLRRLGDDAAVPPHGRSVAGLEERWAELMAELEGS